MYDAQPSTASRGRAISRSFAHVPGIDMPRSTFDRSKRRSMTMDSGFLNPIYLEEILPGDTLKMSVTSFLRLATPVKPVMDNMYVDFFFFFVPNRIVHDNWPKLMGEQVDPGDSIDFSTPICTAPVGGYAFGSLQDHLGIPPAVAGFVHNALPLRGCNLIFNEWFRDQDLQDSLPVPRDDGPDPVANYNLFRRGKRHDYFTACRPFAQKGPSVALPLGTSAPLQGAAALVALASPQFVSAGGGTAGPLDIPGAGANQNTRFTGNATAGGNLQWANPNLSVDLSSVTADLTAASSATINQFRESLALQTFLERNARAGTRYVELLRANFGVISPDQRLQRPEYLGGGSSRISVHPVAYTNTFGGSAPPVGDLAAFATGGNTGRAFTQSFTEHGFVIGFAQVRADLTYQKGLHKLWSRRTRPEYYFPDFAHLGEQEVLSREIYLDGTANDDDVFGYQERFAEYRYGQSEITGKFRSADPQTLDVWHLSQNFTTRPTLGDTFIQDNPPVDRVIVTQTEPQLLADFWFDVKHVRPMPVFGVPQLGARF